MDMLGLQPLGVLGFVQAHRLSLSFHQVHQLTLPSLQLVRCDRPAAIIKCVLGRKEKLQKEHAGRNCWCWSLTTGSLT